MPAEVRSGVLELRCAFHDEDEKHCQASFPDEKALIAHYGDPNNAHVFCSKHKVPCKDWDAFVWHKVTSPDHLCCPKCGVDIKSGKAGLDLHFKQSHPREHEIICPGCQKLFKQAGTYIQHFHRRKCTSITSEEVINQTQRKVMFEKFLSNDTDGHFLGGYHVGSTVTSDESVRASTASRLNGAPLSHQTIGSVQEQREVEFPPLAPVAKPSKDNTSTSHTGSVSSVTAQLEQVQVSTPDQAIDPRTGSISPSSDRGSVDANFSRRPSIASSLSFTSSNPPPSKATTQTFAAGIDQRNEEFDRSTGQRIHPNIGMGRSTTSSVRGNGGVGQFWNPDSAGFDPEMWFNQAIKVYECPFPDCRFTAPVPTLLKDHLREAGDHDIKKWPCPQCRKIFKTQYALISHMESAYARCRIRGRSDFMKIMQKMSGGFVDATMAEREGEFAYAAKRPEGFW